MNKELENLIMSAVDLPAIPVVATKVIQLVESERVTPEELAKTIASDPAVAARILKLSNSAYYGCQRQIQTLSAAIMILGFKTLKSLVVATSLKSISPRFGLTENILWEHSIGAAFAARIIAGYGKFVNEEAGFLVGLFHDIGKTIMNNQDPRKFQGVLQRCYNEGLTFEEAESSAYPFTHSQVGALVVKKWNFPEALSTAIMYHHKFDTEPINDPYERYLTAVASLANKFCKKLGIGEREPWEELDLAATSEADLLGLTAESINNALEFFAETYETNKSFFQQD